MGIETIAAALVTAWGISQTAATIVASIAVACPDADGWNEVLLPGRETDKAAGWRAIGANPKHVEAVQAAIQSAPEGVDVRGLAVNDCLAPLIVEGDVMGTDGGRITPGSVVVFRKKGDALPLAKVYLGASWNGGPVAAFLYLRPAALAMHVAVDTLAELRRVSGIYRAGEWITPDTAAAVARAPRMFTKHVARATLPMIGGTVGPTLTAA